MTQEECKQRLESHIDKLRDNRATGKRLIELDMSQGGVVNVRFYESAENYGERFAVFSSGGGVIVMKKS